MKRIFSVIALVFAWVSQTSFNRATTPVQQPVTALIVNAGVSIVLFDDPAKQPGLAGDSIFMSQVSVDQLGASLVINALRKKDYRDRGTVYIPAGKLEQIIINNCSKISSTGILQIPLLKLSINGECDVSILVNGKVELTGNDSYEIEYHSKDLPAGSPVAEKKAAKKLRV
jgi:hypothetical protein